jgi:aryl-alcohol dehydrogenase-like predicted oxidoreductase
MQLRPFGDTGMHVSEIGLGAWQLANPDWHADDPRAAHQIVAEALAAGCTFFDTAPGYGQGRSETVLGEALAGVRHDVVICTKVGYKLDWGTDFSTAAIRPSLEGSLRRLRTEYVDILLLHNPPRDVMDGRLASQYEELERLRQEGLIRHFGVSLDWRDELELVLETTASQAIEVLYNAFFQEPRAAFPQAQARGAGLIVKVPLDSGWLGGHHRGDSRFTDLRRRWAPEVIARRAALVEAFAGLVPEGVTLAQAALRYTLAHRAVATVIPGARNVEQARANFAAAAVTLPAATIAAIDALWEREIRADPLPW